MNTWIQQFAELNGVTQPVNGSWIQAICESEGITQPVNGTWIEALARNKGATEPYNGSWWAALAIALGITEVSNGTWIQALAEDGAFSAPLGVLFQNEFTSANWTKVGTQTVTNNGVTLTQSGGNGTFNNYYFYNAYNTCLEKIKFECTATVNTAGASDFGWGIGLKSSSLDSTKDAVMHFVTGGANKGKFFFWFANKLAVTFTSVGTLAFNAGDVIKITFERDVNVFTGTAENLTTPSSITGSYTITSNFAPPQGEPRMPNNSNPCIWQFGGSQVVTNFTISSNELDRQNLLIIGDSKTQGYFSGTLNNRFSNLLGAVNNSGAFDRTIEAVKRMNEIIELRPKKVVIFIGCNDIRSGVAAATWQANFNTMNSTLSAAGITVYNCLPAPEDLVNLTTLKTWIESNLPNVIDLWTPFLDGVSGLATAYDPGDGVHLNSAAQAIVASQITNAL